MIQVYAPGNNNFAQNGDMTLMPSTCTASATINGTWTLEMEHPIDRDGRWGYITDQCVLRVPSFNGSQLFRVVSKDKTDTSISVTAEPIFMDARNDCFLVDVRPTSQNGQEALNTLTQANAKYTGKSNISKRTTAYYLGKNLIEAIASDDDNSFLNRWGGEILFDNYTITINDRIGGDYGVHLLYGKNLISGGTKESVDFLDVCTRIYPKAYNGHAMTDNGYVDSPLINSYPTVKARTITYSDIKMREDAQDDEDESVTVCDTKAELDAALKARCQADFDGGLDKPKVSIDVDMALIQNADEYAEYKDIERVSLGDTVHLKHAKLGIESDARIVSLVYDCLRDRVESVTIGDYTPSYFSNVSSVINRVESAIRPDGSLIAERVSGFIDGAMASLKAQYNIAKRQDVLAILFENLDEDSPYYGALGIGTQGMMISKERTADGRAWDWTTAITASGIIADVIAAGLLSDKTGNVWWNLETGEMQSRQFHIDAEGNATFAGDLTAAGGRFTGEYHVDALVDDKYPIKIRSASGNRIGIGADGFLVLNIKTQHYMKLVYDTNNAMPRLDGGTYSGFDEETFAVSSFNRLGGIDADGTLKSEWTYKNRGSIEANVQVTSSGYFLRTSSSSKRYKTDISTELGNLNPAALLELPVKKFKYKDGYLVDGDPKVGQHIIGLIAEDVAEIYPCAAEYDDAGQPETWNSRILLPAMLRLIQDIDKRVKRLEGK